MYEIHNLTANAMIADVAYRRALREPRGTAPRVRWWRRSDQGTSSTHVTH